MSPGYRDQQARSHTHLPPVNQRDGSLVSDWDKGLEGRSSDFNYHDSSHPIARGQPREHEKHVTWRSPLASDDGSNHETRVGLYDNSHSDEMRRRIGHGVRHIPSTDANESLSMTPSLPAYGRPQPAYERPQPVYGKSR